MEKDLQDLVEFLIKVPLFSSVPSEQINKIADLFKREIHQKDDFIMLPGQPWGFHVCYQVWDCVHIQEDGGQGCFSQRHGIDAIWHEGVL